MTTDWMKKETSEWFIKPLTLKLTKTQPGEMYRNTKKSIHFKYERGSRRNIQKHTIHALHTQEKGRTQQRVTRRITIIVVMNSVCGLANYP